MGERRRGAAEGEGSSPSSPNVVALNVREKSPPPEPVSIPRTMVDMSLVIERGRSFVRELVDHLADAGVRLEENPKWNKYGYVEDLPAQELRILSVRVGEKRYEIPTSDLEGASKGYFDSKARLQQLITAIVRDQCTKT